MNQQHYRRVHAPNAPQCTHSTPTTRQLAIASVEQLIETFFTQSPYRHKVAAAAILNAWYQVVPDTVHRRTMQCYVKNNTLFVSLTSPALRQEMQHDKQLLLSRLQDVAKNYVIVDIIIT